MFERMILRLPLLILFSAVFINFVTAQDQNRDQPSFPNQVGAKVLLLNYGLANNADTLRFTNGFEAFITTGVGDRLNFSIPVRAGVQHVPGRINNQSFLGLDGRLQILFQDREKPWIPYALAGGGVVWENFDSTNIQIPIGVGSNIKLGKNSYLNIELEYRYGLSEDRNNLQLGVGYAYQFNQKEPDRDQDGVPDAIDQCPEKVGTKALSGCPDLDNDGITDDADACPTMPGLEAFAGCPDSDEDGVPDDEDRCPEVAGLTATKGCPDEDLDGVIDSEDECPEERGRVNGCPDKDEDGIADKDDACPDEAGVTEYNGCPARDSDGDGIIDVADECPNEKGSPETKGCPDTDGDGFADLYDSCPELSGEFDGCPDTDQDGLHDAIDECPYLVGTAATNGCPDGAVTQTEATDGSTDTIIENGTLNIAEADRIVLSEAAQNVQFETGSAILKAESFEVLRQIVDILNRYPEYSLSIEGHTDNVGNAQTNLELSEERAKACYEYILSKGVVADRLYYQGLGETTPIDTNTTRVGRSMNRRVEFVLK